MQCIPPTALLNTIVATATANYIASHGQTLALNGMVYGIAVAFGIGAIFLALAGIVSAVSVTASASDLQNMAVSPALADR